MLKQWIKKIVASEELRELERLREDKEHHDRAMLRAYEHTQKAEGLASLCASDWSLVREHLVVDMLRTQSLVIRNQIATINVLKRTQNGNTQQRKP